MPWLLTFCFVRCGTRLPTKPTGAGTDMRSPRGTVTGTAEQVVKKSQTLDRQEPQVQSGKKQHEEPPSSIQSLKLKKVKSPLKTTFEVQILGIKVVNWDKTYDFFIFEHLNHIGFMQHCLF